MSASHPESQATALAHRQEATLALGAAALVLCAYAAPRAGWLSPGGLWAVREGLGFFMVAVPAARGRGAFFGPASRRSLRRAAQVACAVLPGWLVLRCWLVHAAAPTWPPGGIANLLLAAQAVWTHVFAVALPEELFWRGWVQPALAARWPARHHVARAPMGAAALVGCALFALSHVVGGGPWLRLATFFPGLLFAWLMARDNAVVGPWALHACCNLWALAAASVLPPG